MGKFINLKNQRFGRLLVLKQADKRGGKICWVCKCDCGKITAPSSNTLRQGKTKSCGCLSREIRKSLKHTPQAIMAMRKSKLSEKNPMWRGNNVGKHALHRWIEKRLKKPKFCKICKKSPPYDLANKSQNYIRDLSDWEWLCRRCHMKKDGRLFKLNERWLKMEKLSGTCN